MRASCFLLALAVIFTSATALQAVPASQGQIVQGRYTATGHSSTAGVRVTYQASSIRISTFGRISGRAIKTITSHGVLIQSALVRVKGSVGTVRVRARKGTFTAQTVVRIGPGAKFRGELTGLADKSQKPSRFFRGKLNGNKHSNFVLRSR